jgi:hypothetical protein
MHSHWWTSVQLIGTALSQTRSTTLGILAMHECKKNNLLTQDQLANKLLHCIAFKKLKCQHDELGEKKFQVEFNILLNHAQPKCTACYTRVKTLFEEFSVASGKKPPTIGLFVL